MKKTWIYLVSATMLTSALFTGCDITSSRNYMGTMAGAEIGGVIGEALGWMSTDRHDGPGRAMMGSVIGTIAGAAIGNVLTRETADRRVTTSRRSDDIYADNTYDGGYQTGGGYDARNSQNRNNRHDNEDAYSSLSIAGVTYQDEDGDGRFSRNETVNIIYEVTNHSDRSCSAELKVETMNDSKNFVLSPSNTVKIEPHETLRYKAKAFCKGRTSVSSVKFRLMASSPTAGNTAAELQIRMSK